MSLSDGSSIAFTQGLHTPIDSSSTDLKRSSNRHKRLAPDPRALPKIPSITPPTLTVPDKTFDPSQPIHHPLPLYSLLIALVILSRCLLFNLSIAPHLQLTSGSPWSLEAPSHCQSVSIYRFINGTTNTPCHLHSSLAQPSQHCQSSLLSAVPAINRKCPPSSIHALARPYHSSPPRSPFPSWSSASRTSFRVRRHAPSTPMLPMAGCEYGTQIKKRGKSRRMKQERPERALTRSYSIQWQGRKGPSASVRCRNQRGYWGRYWV